MLTPMLRVKATTPCLVALYTGEQKYEQSMPATDDILIINFDKLSVPPPAIVICFMAA